MSAHLLSAGGARNNQGVRLLIGACVTFAVAAGLRPLVAAPWKSQLVFHNPTWSNSVVAAMASHDGALYLAADTSELQIYRTSNPACKTWQEVTPTWHSSPAPDTYTVSMQQYKGRLYVGTSRGELYVYPSATMPAQFVNQFPANISIDLLSSS